MPITDWCAYAEELREQRREIIAGGQLVRHRYRQLEEERESQYAPTSLSDLDAAIREAEAKCADQSGEPSRRRCAIRGIRKRY